MPEADQFPRLSELTGAAVAALITARPHADRFLYSGKYGNIIRGLEAQAALVRRQFMAEARAMTLQAEGQALLEYVQSEFFATIETAPLFAVGEAVIKRELTNANSASTGQFAAGLVPRGHRIFREADPTKVPAIDSAEYVTEDDAVFGTVDDQTVDLGGGQYRHEQTVQVNARASREGTHANRPSFVDGSIHGNATLDANLFDTTSTWSATVTMAGGMLELADQQLRQLATPTFQGQYGPNVQAALSGVFDYGGARYAAYSRNYSTAVDRIYVADASWASSVALQNIVKRKLVSLPWLGFGARVDAYGVVNQPVVVAPTVMIRSELINADKTALKESLREAARVYLDERPDWYSWKASSLRSAIQSASREVLTVTNVTVTDRDGASVSEPASSLAEGLSSATHYYLVGFNPTFVTPS